MVSQLDEAVAAAMERAAAEEERGQPTPAPHPMPTREQCWQAWCHNLADRRLPVTDEERREFDRWWEGGDS